MNKQNIKEVFDFNHQYITQTKPTADGLFAGKLGLSYYHAVLYQAFENPEDKDISVELLEEVLEDFYSSQSTLLHASYTGGTAGLGYIICFLNKLFSLDIDLDNDLSDLDEYLFDSAVGFIENNNLDCLHGASGILFYFTQRGNPDYLNKLISLICSKAKHHMEGLWFENTFIGPSAAGFANLSLSHGMSGILIILLNSAPYLDEKNTILLQNTLREGIRFITNYYLPFDAENNRFSSFPPSINLENNEYSHECRLGWCYGDLGIVLLLYKAGKFLNDDQLITRAHEIGLQSLNRKSYHETGINEPFYCHGSAGLSSFYNKLYLESGESKYLEGKNFWMDETANYFAQNKDSFAQSSPHEILDGLIGINIAILEYLKKEQPYSLSNIFFL